MWLLLEILIFGSILTYLLALVPAAVVSVLKRHWIMYVLGFFTFGIGWFLGAYEVAKPGSWWARKAYANRPDPESAAFAQERAGRNLRVAVAGMGALLLIGLVAARPTLLVGTDGGSLNYSVGGFLTFEDGCRRESDGSWTCFRYDNQSSGDAAYRTTVDWTGCWNAESDVRPPPEDPKLSGCVTILDHARIIDRILD